MISVGGWQFLLFLFSLHTAGSQTQEDQQSLKKHLADFPILLLSTGKINIKKLDIVCDDYNWDRAKANVLGILPGYIQILRRWYQLHWVSSQILIIC